MFGRKKHYVRVHTTEHTLEGAIVSRNRDHYRFIGAKMILAEDKSVVLDGEIEVPREKVQFIQILHQGLE